MIKKIIFLLLIGLPFLTQAQTDTTKDLKAYFSATIVNDIDTSIKWYTAMLGFEVIDKIVSKKRGFKQSNLKRKGLLIELIELDKAITLKKTIPNYHDKMRFKGFFKIGFMVSDFDAWIAHLKKKNAPFYGNIVTDNISKKRMTIITDPDGNRIQIFEK